VKKTLLYLHDGRSVYDEFFIGFLKEHYDVHFASFSRAGVRRVSERTGVSVHHLPEMPLELRVHDTVRGMALTGFRTAVLGATVRSIRPDVLLACWATTYGFYVSASGAGPYGLMVWGSDVLVQPRYIPVRAFASRALRKAERVFLDSDVQRRAAIGLGCEPGRIVKFPWADLGWLLKMKVEKDMVRSGLGIPHGCKLVVFDRRHDPIYDPTTLVRAAAIVVRAHPEAFFLIAGEGRLTGRLKDMASELGLGRNARFTGWVERPRLAEYVASSDIYVSTSLSDGTSASLLEAMALGVPPVVTAIPGNLEWVLDGVNGLVFERGDEKGLASAVTRLLRDEVLRASLGERARATVAERADWRRSSLLFLQGLRDVEAARER
jgi:glycosyltransferase involved in cell wall biosynthesis